MIGGATFLIIGWLSTTQALILQDYRLKGSSTCTAPPLKNCTGPGLLCESCTSLVLCLVSSAHFEKTHIQTCTADEKCVGTGCTASVRDPVCDGTACLDFICTDLGVFPDPFDCRKFVFCVPDGAKLKAYGSPCDSGYGFDAATGVCDVKLLNGEGCGGGTGGYPVPLCDRAGETKALPANPSIYYVCQRYSKAMPVLYPLQRICPHGTVFDNHTYACK